MIAVASLLRSTTATHSENWGDLFLEERMSTDARIWRLQELIVVVPALLATLSAGCERRIVSAAPPQPPTVEVTNVVWSMSEKIV